MTGAVIPRSDAVAAARAALDAARRQRDRMSPRQAAEAAAPGSGMTAAQIEALIRQLRAGTRRAAA